MGRVLLSYFYRMPCQSFFFSDRRATTRLRGEASPVLFLKLKKALILEILRLSRREKSKILPYGAYFSCIFDKMFIEVPQFHKISPAALPKNNNFTGIFHGFCLPFRNSFSKEHLLVAASQLFIIQGKTAIFKILIEEYNFQREFSQLQLQLGYYCQVPVPGGLAASIYHLASYKLGRYLAAAG